ncbi:hypothetical protein [Streptomyces sp. NPDC060184]|uniref:hypothetical protein n=1 Tax=Streptomyces sp. NPDC060184 TaxID=3347064 RepID=UPI0036546D46
MYVLIPDDPVFFAKFQSLEEPLLRHLHRLHGAARESHDEHVIADAYDSWVQVLLKLPLWSRWHTDAPAGQPPGEQPRYVLHGANGGQLATLYPIEVSAVDLGRLTACLDLFVLGARNPGGVGRPPGAADPQDAAGPSAEEEHLTDVFRRVMEVLLLPPPRFLLDTVRQGEPSGPVVSVNLRSEEEADYRSFCEEIVTILSSGDTFAHRSHRALYY